MKLKQQMFFTKLILHDAGTLKWFASVSYAPMSGKTRKECTSDNVQGEGGVTTAAWIGFNSFGTPKKMYSHT